VNIGLKGLFEAARGMRKGVLVNGVVFALLLCAGYSQTVIGWQRTLFPN